MTGVDFKRARLIVRGLTEHGDDAVRDAIADELTAADAYRDAVCSCGFIDHIIRCPVRVTEIAWHLAQAHRRAL